MWSFELPDPVVSVFDVYRKEDHSIALSKQNPPKSLNKGAIGDLLSLIPKRNGISTAYVGVYEGSLYALSTKNYPLVQRSPWASMYTGRKPGDTSPLIGESPNDTEWKIKPHEMCCHGCEYHIDCMIGQHVVHSVQGDFEDSRFLLPASSSTASSVLPTVLPPQTISQYDHSNMEEYNEKHNEGPKSGFFNEGFGKFWKSYILVSSVIVYVYRDRMLTFYEVKVLPKWKKMMKKRAKAKKTKARIAAAARAEREKINRERADSITSIGSFDADSYIKQKIDEQFNAKEKERLRLLEEKEAEEKKKKEEEEEEKRKKEEEEKEAEEKLKSAKQVIVVKKQSTGLDLESFQQSKSRVLEISDNVLGKTLKKYLLYNFSLFTLFI